MIGTPTKNEGRNTAKSPENNQPTAVKSKKSDSENWRDRKTVHFEDTGFDEGEIPELPFIEVPDVSEIPMKGVSKTDKGILNRDVPLENEGPAYKFVAPVQEAGKVRELVDKLMDSEISVKTSDLLSASKPMREEFKHRVTQQRVPTGEEPKSSKVLSQVDVVQLRNDAIDAQFLPEPTLTTRIEKNKYGEKVSTFIVGDVVLQYLETLAPGETPKQIVVAKDSQSLRSVYPLLNGRAHVESLIDSGSQIVSTSQKIAEKAGLHWDPDIVIYMQSANRSIEKSLGLARNVPFVFGDMTVLLQVHIIREPAYDLLLGRPFDTLTESQISNFADGGQTLTLTEPMTKRRVTIPTYQRGTTRETTILEKPLKTDDNSTATTKPSIPVVAGFPITSRN